MRSSHCTKADHLLVIILSRQFTVKLLIYLPGILGPLALILFIMADHPEQQYQHRLPPTAPGPPKYSSLVRKPEHSTRLQGKSSARSRSRSPHQSNPNSPPTKKTHTISDNDSDGEHIMDIADKNQFPDLTKASAPKPNSFLLSNYDPKFQAPKILMQQFQKYVSRDTISRLIPTRNGIIIHSTDPNLATTIRNKHSFEIFGKNATISQLEPKSIRQPPPPRKFPTLSVVIRGVELDITDTEAEEELKLEGYSIQKCLRIKSKQGSITYMVRVLTNSQETIDDLLTNGAYIYRKRYRVEPSHSAPPLPVRCEKCQRYNDHPTSKCTNETKCGYCSGSHATKSCTNLQQQPKCNTCNEAHPTFSYKCKARPAAEPNKPELIVPLRTTEQKPQPTSAITSVYQPITIELLLKFITVTLQNLHPFQRQHVLQQIQYAARTTLNVSFNATYSGTYIYCHATAYETEV